MIVMKTDLLGVTDKTNLNELEQQEERLIKLIALGLNELSTNKEWMTFSE